MKTRLPICGWVDRFALTPARSPKSGSGVWASLVLWPLVWPIPSPGLSKKAGTILPLPGGEGGRMAQSQRDCVLSPKVARNTLPWERHANERNPVGVVIFSRRLSRVARSSRPRAGSRNPVGIHLSGGLGIMKRAEARAPLAEPSKWLFTGGSMRQSIE